MLIVQELKVARSCRCPDRMPGCRRNDRVIAAPCVMNVQYLLIERSSLISLPSL